MPSKNEVAAFLAAEFPQNRCLVEDIEGATATVRRQISHADLRPGGTVSGPVLMEVADLALYVALLGEIGIVPLMVDAFSMVVERLGLTPTDDDLAAVRAGHYDVSRLDYNRSFELPSRADVHAWLRAAEYKSKTRHGRPSMTGGTLYFGKTSRRWSLKFYSKGEEINAPKHQLPDELQHPELIEWAENKLRAELTLRTTELIDINLRKASSLTPETLFRVFLEYMRTLEMNEQIALSSEEIHSLPQRLRSTYILWNSGEDLRHTLSRPTYYRHRHELLGFGIDIALRKESIDRSNVVPLVRVLEAVPAAAPEWAFHRGLIHQSARRSA